jgi:MFS transporter, DHA1 family, multidrug resistance protein
MLWLGWSGFRKDVHWIAPTLSGLLRYRTPECLVKWNTADRWNSGFGIMAIFLQALNYLIDAYLMVWHSQFVS